MMDSSSMKYAQEAYLKEHDTRPGADVAKETFMDPLGVAFEAASAVAVRAEALADRLLGSEVDQKCSEVNRSSPTGILNTIAFASREVNASLRRIETALKRIEAALP